MKKVKGAKKGSFSLPPPASSTWNAPSLSPPFSLCSSLNPPLSLLPSPCSSKVIGCCQCLCVKAETKKKVFQKMMAVAKELVVKNKNRINSLE